VAGVFVCKSFAGEDVAEMAAAAGADDLHPLAIRIGDALDRAGNLVIKARPAAAGMEFILRAVERGVAALAEIGAFRLVVGVLPGEGPLRPLVQDHPFLVRSQFVIFHLVISGLCLAGAGQ